MTHRLRVALIGLGAIGQSLARGLLAHSDSIEVVSVLVRQRDQGRLTATGELAPLGGLITEDPSDMLHSQPELVIECAGHAAVDAHGRAALEHGCDLLVVSVGALADAVRLAALKAAAHRSGRKILLVAGAIGGTDWLAAARLAGLQDVVYRGSKPPLAWKGSPAEGLVDLEKLSEPTLLFEGSASDAARDYPRNANVAATVALASLGMERTRVELWADPRLHQNCHEVEAWGAAGHLHLKLENQADPENPRTSRVTAYSALKAVLDRRAALVL